MLFFTEFWTFEIHHLSSHYPCHTKHDRSTAISTSFSTCWKNWLLKSYLTSIINIFLYQMKTKNSYAFKWSSTHVPVVTFIMHLLKKSPLTSIRNSKIQSFLTFHVIACVNWFVDPTIQAAETDKVTAKYGAIQVKIVTEKQTTCNKIIIDMKK